jgi:hypothetical protein
MKQNLIALAALPFIASGALAADKLSARQLAAVIVRPSLPKVSTVCNYSDCIPHSWDATLAWLRVFEQIHTPTIVPGTGSQLPAPTPGR